MFQWLALFDRIWNQAGTWLLSARGQTISVLVLLTTHAGLLAYSATCHSPTYNEPAHLVAGISNWQFGRFELYRVNPPLTRMVAAVPVMIAGCETDWSKFYDAPGARPVFDIGYDFVKVNGERSIWLFTIARWACIPIALIGGLTAFCLTKELYSNHWSGLIALTLWCFCPNILAYGELITGDAAAASFGLLASYMFWRWLKRPTWADTFLAGFALGLAQISKMSWVILFGLWPILWVFWQLMTPSTRVTWRDFGRMIAQICVSLLLGLYVLNVAYLFEGSFTPLSNYDFVSEALAGEKFAGKGGNRFRDTFLADIPMPVPKQYLIGLDSQKRDFETYAASSFLNGEWRDGGWWYYYLYAILVKMPHGTQLLLLCAIPAIWLAGGSLHLLTSEVVIMTPAITLFTLVSVQTEFNHHFRYVLPSLSFLFVLAAKTGVLFQSTPHTKSSGIAWRILVITCVILSISSSLCSYPNEYAYYNELSRRADDAESRLLHSATEWGQGLRELNHKCSEWESKTIVCIESPAPYDLQAVCPHLIWWTPTLESLAEMRDSSNPVSVSDTLLSWLSSGSSFLTQEEKELHAILVSRKLKMRISHGFTVFLQNPTGKYRTL